MICCMSRSSKSHKWRRAQIRPSKSWSMNRVSYPKRLFSCVPWCSRVYFAMMHGQQGHMSGTLTAQSNLQHCQLNLKLQKNYTQNCIILECKLNISLLPILLYHRRKSPNSSLFGKVSLFHAMGSTENFSVIHSIYSNTNKDMCQRTHVTHVD